MANRRGKAVDTSSLSTLGFIPLRGVIHRDYFAHVLRFAHVARYLMDGHRAATAHLLDVGCGRESPLSALMYSNYMTHMTGSYTGVDVGPIDRPYYLRVDRKKFHGLWYPHTDLTTWDPAPDDPVRLRAPFNIIVMLEVAEHVEPLHAFRLLQRIRGLLAPGGVAFISTPNYKAHLGAAPAHVNEMTHAAFTTLLAAAGLAGHSTGTFASQCDYKPYLKTDPVARALFDRLGAYYHTCVVACLMAPMLPPALARNALWEVGPAAPTLPLDRAAWADPAQGSSALWTEHANQIYQEVSGVK